MVSVLISDKERKLSDSLLRNNLIDTHQKALILTILFTRQHIRPFNELVDILRQYPLIGNKGSVSDDLNSLLSQGLIQRKETKEYSLYYCDSSVIEKLKVALSENEYHELQLLRSTNEPTVTYCAPLSDELSYTTFVERLKSAQSEILLPMLVTSPNMHYIDILRDRANNGVKVRILFGSEAIVSQVRGASLAGICNEYLNGWMAAFKDCNNVSIRVMSQIDDAKMASSAVIDNSILRLVVYDYLKQRSLQGCLIEVANASLQLNVTDWFIERFEEAWSRALNPTKKQFPVSWAKNKGAITFAIGVICVVVYFMFPNPVIEKICIGVFSVTLPIWVKRIIERLNSWGLFPRKQ